MERKVILATFSSLLVLLAGGLGACCFEFFQPLRGWIRPSQRPALVATQSSEGKTMKVRICFRTGAPEGVRGEPMCRKIRQQLVVRIRLIQALLEVDLSSSDLEALALIAASESFAGELI